MGTPRSRKRKINVKKIIIIIALVIAVICGVVFALIKRNEAQHKKDLEQVQEISRDFEEGRSDEYNSPINFDEIRKSNEDIVAWIEVPGTAIDYPILQSGEDDEEDFYLNHNIDGSGGYPGCIYIQKCNSGDFSDLVTVVYGHNMKDGTMFKDLHKFQDLSFYEENTEFTIYTPEATKKYRIIAATKYDDRLIPDSFNNFAERGDAISFLASVSEQGNTVTNHQVTGEDIYNADGYVVLSTCTSDPSVRYIVVGMLTDAQ